MAGSLYYKILANFGYQYIQTDFFRFQSNLMMCGSCLQENGRGGASTWGLGAVGESAFGIHLNNLCRY